MKIAVATTKKGIKAKACSQAGRAPFYLIFEDGVLVETWKNPFRVGGGGAGFSVAKAMADKEVKKIIAAQMGDKMKGALRERGIEFAEIQGTAQEVTLRK